MKIVIADDERIIRLSLISMIEELKLMDCSIVQCKNGKEMIDAVNSLKPEIVFVDIKMPLFNGLEAIEQCKNNSKNTEFIITSGFSEFEYARKAIQLGVYDYLLKPIDPINLSVIINKILEENRKKSQGINEEFQSNMVELCYDECLINEELINHFYSNKKFTACLFYLDNNLDNDELILMKKKLLKTEEPIINEIIYENINIAKISTGYNSTLFIFSYLPEDYNKINKYINKIIGEYMNNNSYFTTITSNKLESIKTLKDEIEKLRKNVSLRIVFGIEENYSINEFLKCDYIEKHYSICDTIDNISVSFKNDMFIKFCNALEKLERILLSDKAILKDETFYSNINLFLKKTINFQGEDKFSSTWISEFYKYKEKFLKKLSKNKDISEQIMEFINQNYMYEISITTLSEIFDLTPNYLSSLFHKKTSMKLVDYVAKVRVNKSQNLLAETDLNVNDISEAVGYHSSRYFTKLFKSINGVSPCEYRKNLMIK